MALARTIQGGSNIDDNHVGLCLPTGLGQGADGSRRHLAPHWFAHRTPSMQGLQEGLQEVDANHHSVDQHVRVIQTSVHLGQAPVQHKHECERRVSSRVAIGLAKRRRRRRGWVRARRYQKSSRSHLVNGYVARKIQGGNSNGDKMRVNNGTSKNHPRW